jgi:hypothetical protein
MAKDICAVDGCERERYTHGLCRPHGRRLRLYGTTEARKVATPLDRFSAKYRVLPNGCWEWTASTTKKGYGHFSLDGRLWLAHVMAYHLFVGPMPAGMVVDHLCHTNDATCLGGNDCPHRRCVNPSHLESVTARENSLRGRSFSATNATKTHCPQGHPYDEVNTYVKPNGNRNCRKCHNAARRPLLAEYPSLYDNR